MYFFVYCRDRGESGPKRKALLKEHWTFMSQYADRMIARGPTLSEDGKVMTGSMHILDLPDIDAASAFAFEDPFAKGGVFEHIMVRRFENVFDRTMWEFTGHPAGQRFLLIAEANESAPPPGHDIMAAQRDYFTKRAKQIILFGPLFETDNDSWCGTALMLEASDRAAAGLSLLRDPVVPFYISTDLRRWRFGGEENLKDMV